MTKVVGSWVAVRVEPLAQVSTLIVSIETNRADAVGLRVGVVVDVNDTYWPKREETRAPAQTPFGVGERIVFRNYLHEINQHDGLSYIDLEDVVMVVEEGVSVTN
jgi:hypothetical protein